MDQPPLQSMHDSYLNNLKKIVIDNIRDEHFGVEELAEKAGISRSQLHRKLKQLKGITGSDYIRNIRLKQSIIHLKNNTGTISEIAYQLGFSSPSYFNKVFQKEFNITPGEYKKNPKEYDIKIETNFSPEPAEEDSKSVIKLKKYIITGIAAAVLVLLIIVAARTIFDKHPEVSIAVLPLENLTGSDENEYFVEGIHDALIGELGKIGSIRVISRKSTLQYAKKDMLLADIARELNVNTIVEGSIYGAEDSLRILIQLIKVFPKEKHLWTQDYNERMSKVLHVQNQAIKEIAQHINVNLTEEENKKLGYQREVVPETYKDYLRGMYYLKKGNEKDYQTGIDYMYKTIERDPADPFAYAALALAYAATGHGMAGEDAFDKAIAAANKALEIDPYIDEAYTAMAMLYLYESWEWNKAKDAFDQALIANPNNEIALANYSWYFVLFNDIEKAIYYGKKSVEIDPFSVAFSAWLSLIYLEVHQYNLAEKYANRALKMNPKARYASVVMACICLEKDSIDKATEYIETLPKKSDYWNTYRAGFYAQINNPEKLHEIWDYTSNKKNASVGSKGIIAYHCGYKDLAYSLFDEAIKLKNYPINYFGHIPFTYDKLNDPKIREIFKQLNLPSDNMLVAESKAN